MKIAVVVAASVAALALAGCGTTRAVTSAAQSSQAPTVTVTQAKPAPKVTVTKTAKPKIVTATPAAPAPAPAPAQPQFANADAVVTQFYQDITNQDYADAWALGGDNIAAQNGQTYASWVAGYGTTASITLATESQFNATTVDAGLVATQDDGTVKTYEGTYTVIAGVITSADITQTS